MRSVLPDAGSWVACARALWTLGGATLLGMACEGRGSTALETGRQVPGSEEAPAASSPSPAGEPSRSDGGGSSPAAAPEGRDAGAEPREVNGELAPPRDDPAVVGDAGSDPREERALRDAPEAIEQGCVEWALAYCAKLENCEPEAYFNIGLCSYEASRTCYAQVGLAGSAFDVPQLEQCRGRIAGQDCAQFLAEVNEHSSPTWGYPRYIERCTEATGELGNGEPCAHYHQCRSGACESFHSAAGRSCLRCVADHFGQSEARARRPEFQQFEAEGDPASDGACTNPLLEAVEGVCVRAPAAPLPPCEQGDCGPAREGQYCSTFQLEMGPYCEPGTFCDYDANSELGGPGTCVALPARSDQPNPDAYSAPYPSLACYEEQLGEADRQRASVSLGFECVHERELDPSYLGAQPTELWVDKDLRGGSPLPCVVDHFQGRASCPYGQSAAGGGCTTPYGDPVDGPVAPQLRARVARTSIYYTCRCDGDDPTDYYCACPAEFTCQRLTESLGVSGWASFCVRDDSASLDLELLAAGEVCDAALENCGPLPESAGSAAP